MAMRPKKWKVPRAPAIEIQQRANFFTAATLRDIAAETGLALQPTVNATDIAHRLDEAAWFYVEAAGILNHDTHRVHAEWAREIIKRADAFLEMFGADPRNYKDPEFKILYALMWGDPSVLTNHDDARAFFERLGFYEVDGASPTAFDALPVWIRGVWLIRRQAERSAKAFERKRDMPKRTPAYHVLALFRSLKMIYEQAFGRKITVTISDYKESPSGPGINFIQAIVKRMIRGMATALGEGTTCEPAAIATLKRLATNSQSVAGRLRDIRTRGGSIRKR